MAWVTVLVVSTTAVTLLTLLTLRRRGRPDEERGATSVDFSANLALAVYLLVLAYAAVLCRDAISTSQADVQAEAETLTEMYWSVAPIPEAAQIRTQIREYSAQSANLDWPLMAEGEMSPVPARILEDMRAATLRLRPVGKEAEDLRQDALLRASEVSHARAVRADDAEGGLENIFVISMIISGVLVIALPWTLGMKPTRQSVISDAVRVGVVVIGIGFIMLISHPFTGVGAVGPDALRAAQHQYDRIDGQFPQPSQEG
ncbi:bestrophin-like domain [Streptosporangium sandarakinum]